MLRGASALLEKQRRQWLNPRVPRTRLTFFWPLRLIAVLSLVGPALFLAYDIWESRRAIEMRAEERIEHALDVLQEHALKGLQTVERSISEANEVLRNLSDAEIRTAEPDLFLRLKRTQQALPQIEAIWAFDRGSSSGLQHHPAGAAGAGQF